MTQYLSVSASWRLSTKRIIRLVHKTAQEYFEQIQEALSPDALNDIASTCLTYLLFKPFRAGHCLSDSELEYRLEKNPFLDYAAHFWSQHTQMAQEKQVQDLATSSLENSYAIASVGNIRPREPIQVQELQSTQGSSGP